MFIGYDLSLNHSGAVALDDHGCVREFWFVSDKKRACDQSEWHGLIRGSRAFTKAKTTDAENHQLARMNFYRWWIRETLHISGAEHAGIEGYAFAAVSNSSYQYGELGGLARMTLTRNRAKLRVHDPLSVKMWATGRGNANADDVLATAPADLQELWRSFENGLKGQQVAEDLAAAYWVAHLVMTEQRLRTGRNALTDFDEKRVRVFTRVTKTYPTNLLAREWITP
jgi:Holliday junction resolvasome RuvABC endonuclease subunit